MPGDKACDKPSRTWHREQESGFVTVSPGHSPAFEGKGQSSPEQWCQPEAPW